MEILEHLGRRKLKLTEAQLYNIKSDLGESTNIAADHPEVVKRLTDQLELCRQDIGDYNVMGKNTRTDAYWTGARAKWLGHKATITDKLPKKSTKKKK